MTVCHFGLLNLGRDKKPGSTDRIDEAAVEKLLDLVGDEEAAVFGVEVNEGDDNNELAIFRRVLKGWTMYAGKPGHRVREPIFLSPDQPEAHQLVRWIPNTAVLHWSPQRSVLRVNLADEPHSPPQSLVACHNAAGPHTAGDRPDRYEHELADSWTNSNTARVSTKRHLHGRGRNVTEMSDLNHYDLPGMPGELTVVHHRTDYGFAFPADGYQARFRPGRSAGIGLDSHGIKTMQGTYHRTHEGEHR